MRKVMFVVDIIFQLCLFAVFTLNVYGIGECIVIGIDKNILMNLFILNTACLGGFLKTEFFCYVMLAMSCFIFLNIYLTILGYIAGNYLKYLYRSPNKK